MKLHPRLSSASVELVMRFEGLRRRAARLPGGGWTIGYGHTASARQGALVTAAEARALLTYDLSRIASEIDALAFTPLNANQFDALVSFAFNIGGANFRSSAVLKRINEGRLLQAASELELWRKAAFEGEDLVLDALVRRRAAEKALFLTPPEGFRPAPTPVLPPQLDGDASSPSEPMVVTAGLDGETATVEREALELFPDEAPLSATRVAAANVSAKLQELIPDVSEPEESATPPPMEALWDGEPEPEAPPAPDPARVTPYSPPPPHAAFELPAPANEAAPVEEVPPSAPPPFPSLERAADFGRRIKEVLTERPATAAKDAPAPSLPDGRRLKLYLGALGVAMFGGAILSMFQDKATFVNLFIGLAGIMCMTPAAVVLLTPDGDS
ncbi:MAG: lysozyme [Caulobacteraceae bacterium]